MCSCSSNHWGNISASFRTTVHQGWIFQVGGMSTIDIRLSTNDGSLPPPPRPVVVQNEVWRWPLLGQGVPSLLLFAGTLAVSPPQHPLLSWPVSAASDHQWGHLPRFWASLTFMTHALTTSTCSYTVALQPLSWLKKPWSICTGLICLKVSMMWTFSVRFGWDSCQASCKHSYWCFLNQYKKKIPTHTVIRSKQFLNKF